MGRQPRFTAFNAAGQEIGGDDRLDEVFESVAAMENGYITDKRDGKVVRDYRKESTK